MKAPLVSLFSGLLYVLPLASVAGAETLLVPDDHDTVQDAIDVAEDGDVIEVARGEYEETLDFLGKSISIKGSGERADTLIIGSGKDFVIVIEDAETVELRALTVSGGEGIECTDSGLLLDDVAIIESRANGAFCVDSSLTIRDSLFRDNEDIAIVAACCELAMTNSSVIDNEGAMLTLHFSVCDSTTVVDGCVFSGSGTGDQGAAVFDRGAMVTACVFEDNHTGFFGGALTGGPLTIEDCEFRGNTGGRGGALTLYARDSVVRRCLIVDNESTFGGGAVVVGGGSGDEPAQLTFESCTIADNGGPEGLLDVVEPTLTEFEGTIRFRNCVLWGNGEDPIAGTDDLLVAEIDYSIVERGFDGTGNLDEDPLFLDPENGDYRLDEDSPAVDAGDPDSPVDPDGSTADMGAFTFGFNDFRRGDANADGQVAVLEDALYLVDWLFRDGPNPPCNGAADADGNGKVDALADLLALLRWGFLDGAPPPAPGPTNCGQDPNDVGCTEYELCR